MIALTSVHPVMMARQRQTDRHYLQLVVWSGDHLVEESVSNRSATFLVDEWVWMNQSTASWSKSSPVCCLYCIAVIRTDRFAQPVHDDPTSDTPSSNQCLLQLMSTHFTQDSASFFFSLSFQFIFISHTFLPLAYIAFSLLFILLPIPR